MSVMSVNVSIKAWDESRAEFKLSVSNFSTDFIFEVAVERQVCLR